MSVSRRSFLSLAAATATALLAGCSGTGERGQDSLVGVSTD